MALRRLRYIFIPVFAILLLSHNVSAYTDQQLMLNNYSIRETNGTWRRYDSFADGFYLFNFTNNQNYYSTGFCGYLDHNTSVTVDNMNFDKGTYFTLNMPLAAGTGISPMAGPGGLTILHSGTGGNRVSVPWSIVDTSSFFANVGGDTSSFSSQYTFISIVGVLNDDYNQNTSTICMTQSSSTQPVIFNISPGSSGSLGLGRGNISFFYNQADALKESIDAQNEKENQAISDIDEQSASDITGTDNQNTTNLIGIFSSFVTAMGNASSTNCNFDGDFGNLDLGQMNFCRDDPPTVVQVIGSLVLIAVFVPLAYFLVNRIISEIRSFTNG